MGFSIQDSVTKILLFGVFLVMLAPGCSNSPSELKAYYAENYPAPQPQKSPGQKNGSAVKGERPALNGQVRRSGRNRLPEVQNRSAGRNPAPPTLYDATGKTTGSLKMTRGSLADPVDLNFAASKPKLSEYNVSSLIEGKLLKLVEDAYVRRDENEFTRLYTFFLDSFPQSARRSYLEDKWRTFFYSETLDIQPLKGGIVEVTHPGARDLDEFSHYLAKLKGNGVGTIQLDMVQVMEQPVYLFAKPDNPLGYYFKTPRGPLVDNLLDTITALAHDNGLKVLISFPLRNHPMLGHQSVLIVDESWNAIQNRPAPNGKLDLLNPNGQQYLRSLIQSLLSSQIDGIVFKDDFTHEIYEGFSAAARKQYQAATGRMIHFNRLFVPVKNGGTSQYDILADEAFNDIAVWRTREVKQFLWDLIGEIRAEKKSFTLGLEVTPEMVLKEELSVKWYSTGLSYLKDLDLDLFILKWRKSGSDAESDFDSYRKSARMLREQVLKKTTVFMKVPLSQETNNVIRLNRRIRDNMIVQQDMKMTKLAIGPVSRLQNLDFLYEVKVNQ